MVTTIVPDMRSRRPHWQMPEPRDVEVLGHRIRYWEKGEGRPLVLAHGFSGSAPFEWGRVFDALARKHRVIAPQCIGFAPSEQPDIAYTTAALTDHLGAFFAALDLSDITLVGESFGGWLVGSYAVRFAANSLPPIRRLVIVGGAVGQLQPYAPDAQGFYHAEVAAEVEAWMGPPPVADENDPTRMAIFRDSGLAIGELDADQLARIAVPTLLLWGDRDELIPLKVGETALRAIPGARLVVLHDVGHIPSVECPHEFVAVLNEFCSS